MTDQFLLLFWSSVSATTAATLIKKTQQQASRQADQTTPTTMNDQNETTASPSEPKLCKMGCGFFVSSIGVPCILKFSFDFGDVLFSDDWGGWLGTSACLTQWLGFQSEVVGRPRRSLSNGSCVRPWRLRWATAVVTRSILPQSFSFFAK